MTDEDFDPGLLAAILESAVDGIITIDASGAILSFNNAAERIFGYSPEEVRGQNIRMLMPEPDRSQHDGYLGHYLETGERRIIGIGREVRGKHKDGREFPMHLGVNEVWSGDNRIFAGIVRDNTEQLEMEHARTALIEQLERANAELERFTYTVSHDLKSPLITIKGFLGAIFRDAQAGNIERLSKDIARIEAAADKMKMLLDELLELSRVGRIANPSQTVEMTPLVRDVVALLKGPIEKMGASVTVDSEMGEIFADRLRISEVVQNIIENALKFSAEAQPRPTIEVFARDGEGGQRVFCIRDNGQGVEAQYLGRIFRLFEQLDQQQEGTGIGLALAKRIIEVHKGRIWAESEGLGHGTTICFTIATAAEAK